MYVCICFNMYMKKYKGHYIYIYIYIIHILQIHRLYVLLVNIEHVCVCVPSHVQLFVTPGTVACQDPLSMKFSRQEYWSRVPFPIPGDFTMDQPMD